MDSDINTLGGFPSSYTCVVPLPLFSLDTDIGTDLSTLPRASAQRGAAGASRTPRVSPCLGPVQKQIENHNNGPQWRSLTRTLESCTLDFFPIRSHVVFYSGTCYGGACALIFWGYEIQHLIRPSPNSVRNLANSRTLAKSRDCLSPVSRVPMTADRTRPDKFDDVYTRMWRGQNGVASPRRGSPTAESPRSTSHSL